MSNQNSSNNVLKEWISLNKYSNKYQISVSTLRRRIRSHRIIFNLVDGKYFLRDEKFSDKDKGLAEDFSSTSPILDSVKALEQTTNQNKNTKEGFSPNSNPLNLDKFLDTQSEMVQRLVRQDQKIDRLQSQLQDLQTLMVLLEKENKELKILFQKEKRMENWLHS